MKSIISLLFSLIIVCNLLQSCSEEEIVSSPSVVNSLSVETSRPSRIGQASYSNYSFVDVYNTNVAGIYSATFYGTNITFGIGYYSGSWKEGDLACNDYISISPTYSFMTVTANSYTLHNPKETKIYHYSGSAPSSSDWGPQTFKIIRTHYTVSTFALVLASYVPTNPTPPITLPIEE